MKRFTEWMNKPITWGGYFKLTGICAVAGAIFSVISCVMVCEPDWWVAAKDFVKGRFYKENDKA